MRFKRIERKGDETERQKKVGNEITRKEKSKLKIESIGLGSTERTYVHKETRNRDENER